MGRMPTGDKVIGGVTISHEAFKLAVLKAVQECAEAFPMGFGFKAVLDGVDPDMDRTMQGRVRDEVNRMVLGGLLHRVGLGALAATDLLLDTEENTTLKARTSARVIDFLEKRGGFARRAEIIEACLDKNYAGEPQGIATLNQFLQAPREVVRVWDGLYSLNNHERGQRVLEGRWVYITAQSALSGNNINEDPESFFSQIEQEEEWPDDVYLECLRPEAPSTAPRWLKADDREAYLRKEAIKLEALPTSITAKAYFGLTEARRPILTVKGRQNRERLLHSVHTRIPDHREEFIRDYEEHLFARVGALAGKLRRRMNLKVADILASPYVREALDQVFEEIDERGAPPRQDWLSVARIGADSDEAFLETFYTNFEEGDVDTHRCLLTHFYLALGDTLGVCAAAISRGNLARRPNREFENNTGRGVAGRAAALQNFRGKERRLGRLMQTKRTRRKSPR